MFSFEVVVSGENLESRRSGINSVSVFLDRMISNKSTRPKSLFTRSFGVLFSLCP